MGQILTGGNGYRLHGKEALKPATFSDAKALN
jgi:hypothetical protein